MSEGLFFRCAVVTGASAGLGAEFARQLAGRCGTLVLVARREESMKELARELQAQFPDLEIGVIPADLTDSAVRQRVAEKVLRAGLEPDLLVNNAGMGDYGEFAESDWSKVEAMLRLNIGALTHLTHLLLPTMVNGGGGAVLNVSSLASYLPIPDFAVYAATKSYVTSFSEALRIELREHGIRVSAVCPGPARTEFGEVARRSDETVLPVNEWFRVSPEEIVSEALRGVDQDRARVVPGWQVAAAAVAISVLPIVAIRLIMGFRPRR